MMKMKNLAQGAIPVVLLAALIWVFLAHGPVGVLKQGFPPIESVSFERVTLEEDLIILDVINDGPDPVEISQVLVNDAYNKFTAPRTTLGHLEHARITIPYPWERGLPLKITLLTADGLVFDKEIAVATETPVFTAEIATTLGLLGIYVGVIPVFLGLLWLPFLRNISRRTYDFFLSLTVGLLVFLSIDAVEGALEISSQVPVVFQGPALIVIGFFVSILTLTALARRGSVDVTRKSVLQHKMGLSYKIALAIGIHNLGEGLAIGGAFAVGEISLGSMLVVGFMMHNLTEGIAIVAPIAREQGDKLKHIIYLGLIAGAPTVAGAWIGGFAYSPIWSVLFLSIGAGAILHVVIEVTKHMAGEAKGNIFTFSNLAGFVLGMLIMYVTGLFVL